MRAVIPAVLLTAACAAPMAPPSFPPHGPGPAVPERLRAVGTEPFWAASIAGATLIYMTPENQQGTAVQVRRADGAGAAVFSGVLAGRPLRLRIAQGQCSDGMSDTVYPYAAELDLGGERRSGCARPG